MVLHEIGDEKKGTGKKKDAKDNRNGSYAAAPAPLPFQLLL